MNIPSLKRDFGRIFTESERRLLAKAIIITFAIGMAAHAYAFFGPIFSHDSLNALYAGFEEDLYKIRLGRVLVPLYRVLTHGKLAVPWLTGLWAMLWISLAVYAVVRMFQLRGTPVLALTGGIFALNVTVTAMTATYIQELDVDMCAMLFAALAAWVWSRGNGRWPRIAVGAVLAALSMALYQSYICVTITLIMIFCILQLLNHRGAKAVLIHGLQALAMLATAALLYVGMVKIATAVCHVQLTSGDYNSVTNVLGVFGSGFVGRIAAAYNNFIWYFLKYACQYTGFSEVCLAVVHVGLFAIPGLIGLRVLFSRRYALADKLLLVGLVLLLPLGMNFSCALAGGAHALMHFAFGFLYLLALLTVRFAAGPDGFLKPRTAAVSKVLAGGLTAVILLGNVQASNAIYLKKELEREATLSTFTRVAEEMAGVEGYVPGSTPVVFCRSGSFKAAPEPFDRYRFITGLNNGLQTTYPATYANYFKYILKEPICIADADVIERIQSAPETAAMPVYPQDGYAAMVDGALVVRLD